ncbi:MAG: integrase arm-type DNA-binding domain-containing protein [Pseudomonadota bacterium]
MATGSDEAKKPRGRHPEKRLTAPAVRHAAPGRHADGNGLYLEVDQSGAKRWLLRTMVQGRRRDIGLGSISYVTLAEAREMARELRKVARAGGDPIAERDRDKKVSLTFEQAARRVHAENVAPVGKSAKTTAQWLSAMERDIFPKIGQRPVHAIDQADLLRALSPIWLVKPETARRNKQRIKAVIDWARAHGMGTGIHPVEGIDRALPKQNRRPRNFAALPWKELPRFWPQLEEASGVGALALRFTILTAARSGEVRMARTSEIDLDDRIWVVPAERMKAGKEHRVPLSGVAVSVLEEALQLPRSTRDDLVFPSMKPGRPMSDMTLAAVLKRMEVPVTVHGFRSTFRDWAEDATSFSHEVKEAALAHAISNAVERAYRRTDLFEKRRAMMDAWASYVTLAGGAVVRLGA